MEQNNTYGQGVAVEETREPLPVFEAGSQPCITQQSAVVSEAREPLPAWDMPAYTPTYTDTRPKSNPQVEACVDSAFSKSLAATIMAWFPFCSIVGIILGCVGSTLVKKANDLAAIYGISAGGKNVAAKVLAMVGKIAGIAMTAFWAFYLLYFVLWMALIVSSY